MRLKDVPMAPAYLVYHDGFMNGAMDVWPMESLQAAQGLANLGNGKAEAMAYDDAGSYRAYTKLPRVKVWAFHSNGAPKL